MQIIEKNSFNVRTSYFEFKSKNSMLKFITIPVIHIGSKDYYKQICDKLDQSDYIIYEGVKSKKANILILGYEILGKIKKLELITQKQGINYNNYLTKLIHNDINGNDFDNSWNKLSFLFRLSLIIFIPIYIILFFFIGTKKIISKNIELNDLLSRDEFETKSVNDNFNKLDDLIINKRDKIIIENINNFYKNNINKNLNVAILYGAEHFRSIIKYLFSIDYKINKSEWIKAFDL